MEKQVTLNKLFKAGLLSFDRDKAFFDLLKDSVSAEYEKRGDNTIITATRGENKLVIRISPAKVALTGSVEHFKEDVETAVKNAFSEYALSVRAKKDLLYSLSIGEFFRFVLVPALLESYFAFQLDLGELCDKINRRGANKRILFFNVKQKVKTECANGKLSVSFGDAKLSVKLEKERFSGKLMDKNVDIGKFQAETHDAFFAGLPYTLAALNNKEAEYSFKGSAENLKQLAVIILDGLHEMLMFEND